VPLEGANVLPIELERLHVSPFAIVKLSVAVSPPLMVLGVAVNELIVGFGFTVTLAFPVSEQPAPFVTVTESWTGPIAPAVHVIALVPDPAVIVPFVIVQAYVAPAPALGTEAALPVDAGQTLAGAVIIAVGGSQTVIWTV